MLGVVRGVARALHGVVSGLGVVLDGGAGEGDVGLRVHVYSAVVTGPGVGGEAAGVGVVVARGGVVLGGHVVLSPGGLGRHLGPGRGGVLRGGVLVLGGTLGGRVPGERPRLYSAVPVPLVLKLERLLPHVLRA